MILVHSVGQAGLTTPITRTVTDDFNIVLHIETSLVVSIAFCFSAVTGIESVTTTIRPATKPRVNVELVPSTENISHSSEINSKSHINEISSVTVRPSQSKSTTEDTDEDHSIQHQDYYQDQEFTTVKPYRPPAEG